MAAFFIIWFVFVAPRMKKKYEANKANAKDKIQGNEEQVKQELLNDPEILKPIADQTQESNFLAIANCMEKRDLSNVIKDGAINAAGSALGKVTGLGVKKYNNLGCYFIALTEKHFHYLNFYGGDCEEHLKFDRPLIQHMHIEKSSLAANYTGGSSGTDKLTFEYKGKTHAFYLYKMFVRFPTGEIRVAMGATSENQIMATELFTKPLYDMV